MAKKKHPEHVNHERWLVSYADFITLLFAFFVVMFAVSQVDTKKVGRFTESFSRAVGAEPLLPGGAGILADGAPPRPPEPVKHVGDGDSTLPAPLEAVAKALQGRADELGGLGIVRRRNELVLRLSDSVLFDSGDDTVKEPARRVLLAISNELRDRPVEIRIEGHTDDIPIRTDRFRSNWDLSTARATAVIGQLAGPGRIPPTRLAASGYGEFRPIASNTTKEGRAQNRRVDLVIASAVELPPSAEQPAASAAPSAAPTALPRAPEAEPAATIGPPEPDAAPTSPH